MEKSWMKELASHYETSQKKFPNTQLIIIFNLENTILNGNNLSSYASWAPVYRGVLEIIRWFIIQKNTTVGLISSKPASLKKSILDLLNKLGKELEILFTDNMLYMDVKQRADKTNPNKFIKDGIEYFRHSGFHVFAYVDSNTTNLKSVSKIDPQKFILLLYFNLYSTLHAESLPLNTVSGKTYDLTELITENALPKNMQFVWHGINDEENLKQFLNSKVVWGEIDIRRSPYNTSKGNLILRHDSFAERIHNSNEPLASPSVFLKRIYEERKSAKLDLKAGGDVIDLSLELVESIGFSNKQLWFNGNVERIQENGFKKIKAAHPDSIIQCPVDFLAPIIGSTPEKAREILDMYTSWGINRFSLSWLTANFHYVFHEIKNRGLNVNIYNVPDLNSFLQAVLLLPSSVTTDFNFPEWNYYGRGSGENGNYHEYPVTL